MSTLPQSSTEGFIIAIDGPVASGKGTITPLLAKQIGGFYLYSGSVFRCLAYLCLQKGINTTDEQAVREEIADVDLLLTDTSVLLHGIDVTEAIKREEIGMASSTIGMFASARSAMVRIMRKIAAEKMSEGIIVVTEGRDMATTVFPHAAVKVFLTAEPAVRAKRRLEQAQQRGETHLSFEQVLADTIKRDKQDTEREISPLAKEPEKTGYGVIDSSFLTAAETIEWILAIIKQKGL